MRGRSVGLPRAPCSPWFLCGVIILGFHRAFNLVFLPHVPFSVASTALHLWKGLGCGGSWGGDAELLLRHKDQKPLPSTVFIHPFTKQYLIALCMSETLLSSGIQRLNITPSCHQGVDKLMWVIPASS